MINNNIKEYTPEVTIFLTALMKLKIDNATSKEKQMRNQL